MENREVELRSDEVQEILSYIPNWIIRWGITAIFVTVAMLLLITWIIKFPEVISARIALTTANPPVSIVARSSGKLQIFTEEEELVEQGAYLAAIENPANGSDVQQLKLHLESFRGFPANPHEAAEAQFNESAALGELQSPFSEFMKSYQEYIFFVETDYQTAKIKALQIQVELQRDLNDKLIQQKDILAGEVALAEEKYRTAETLLKKNLISQLELGNSKNALLEKEYALKNAESTIINNDIQTREYEKTILDIKQQSREDSRTLILSVQESYKQLQSQLALWEQRYVLKAPADGRVSFFHFWSDNQFVNEGDEVMTVIPHFGALLGKVYLPARGSGKVKSGQKVRIRLDSFPAAEFGVVEGEVASVSLVARDNRYLVNVRLPNELTTSYGKTLEFKQEMQGNADIITEDLRLLQRVFNQLRYIFSSHT